MKSPTCKICLETGPGIQFPLFPKTPEGLDFGEICAVCDAIQVELWAKYGDPNDLTDEQVAELEAELEVS